MRRVLAAGKLRSGSRSLQTYFAGLVALFVLAAVAETLVVHYQDWSGRSPGSREGRSLCRRGRLPKQLGNDVALLRDDRRQPRRHPQIAQTISRPAGCTLAFRHRAAQPTAVISTSCARAVLPSARPARARRTSAAGYAREAWVRQASVAPVFRAPFIDTTSGARVALVSMPVRTRDHCRLRRSPSRGPEAGVPVLAEAVPVEFLVHSSDAQTVIAGWIQPARSGWRFAHRHALLPRR